MQVLWIQHRRCHSQDQNTLILISFELITITLAMFFLISFRHVSAKPAHKGKVEYFFFKIPLNCLLQHPTVRINTLLLINYSEQHIEVIIPISCTCMRKGRII